MLADELLVKIATCGKQVATNRLHAGLVQKAVLANLGEIAFDGSMGHLVIRLCLVECQFGSVLFGTHRQQTRGQDSNCRQQQHCHGSRQACNRRMSAAPPPRLFNAAGWPRRIDSPLMNRRRSSASSAAVA